MNVAAVVLAAGFSRRLGRPKHLVELAGETLLARAVRVANEAGLFPVYVVLREATVVPGAVTVLNEEASEGMASSIRCGIAVAGEVEGVVVIACDQVLLTAEHLRMLVGRGVCGSGYAGRVGVPAFFPRAAFGELMKLRGDVGARALLRGAKVVGNEALATDVDTEEDLRRAREMVG